MTWSFEFSFMVFLIASFVSQFISTKSRSRLSLPFTFGIIFIIGFTTGLFPKDFILSSKIVDVGFIAFNVLVIHSGTTLNIGLLIKERRTLTICLLAVMSMTLVTIFALSPIIGRDLALLSPGSVIGSGAACAIGSKWVLDINPSISVYPWLAFMLQSFFSIPLVSYMLKKESSNLLQMLRTSTVAATSIPQISKETFLCDRISEKYKTTAYYLGILMIISVFNRWLNVNFLDQFNINVNVTALLFGIILGQLGIIDKNPLSKADCFGLLMLGLMGLMANTLSNTPLSNIISLVFPLIIAFTISTLILITCGIIASKVYGFSAYRGIAICVNCMIAFPFNIFLVKECTQKFCQNEEESKFLEASLIPSLNIGSIVMVNIFSVFLISIMVNLI